MWDRLSEADLEAVKQRLKDRREETLRRHAEELRALENDRVEIEKLDQLIDAFAKKFQITTPSIENAATAGTEPSGADPARAHPVSGISLFITQAQKAKLRQLGIADAEIRDMKPHEAHRILGLAS
jgi:hypothetical protein